MKNNRLKTGSVRSFEAILCAALCLTLVISLSTIFPVSAETLGSWNSTTPWANSFSSGITGESCATYSGYIYCVGGFLVGGPRSGVYYAPISSSGVGTWAATTSYPTGFDQGSCAISSGYIYCVGGQIDSNGDYTAAVYYATVSSSGVGTWTLTTALPIIIEQESCAISGGYIYCVGGTSDTSYPYTPGNGVFYAQVSASGVGTWTVSNYPTVIAGESCSISAGYIYCVGGDTAPNPIRYTDLVIYAPVSSSGVGTWTTSTHYPTDVTFTSCDTNSGYIYCVGGFVDGATFTNAVYYAPVSSSGVGTWSSTTNYPEIIYLESCDAYLGYIYCVGGQTTNSIISGSVYYASISSLSPVETSTSVTCSPTSVASGSSSTCTATVSGATPTGSVAWSSSSATGVFSASSCTLATSSCSVSYSDSTIGAPVITASYGGDSANLASTGATILANFKTIVTSASISATLLSGTTCVDETATTGVGVCISGSTSPAGTNFVVESSNLACSATPSGLTLTNGQCYDVKISGVIDGTANICLSNQVVDASTLMYYYSGGSWVAATVTSLTISSPLGNSNGQICSNVPVSALQGTPVAMGDPQILSAPEFPAGAILATVIPLLALAMFAVYRMKNRISSAL